jgi:hypothetical protein
MKGISEITHYYYYYYYMPAEEQSVSKGADISRSVLKTSAENMILA